MSGLETLSPDQRAVLQLILVQGRGYDDLAATLKLDPAAVRERAHAGAEALAPDAPDPALRGRVVDYLLGQQDDGERIVTFAALGDSPAACRWAQALRGQLAGVARVELPEVPGAAAPAPVSANGNAVHAAAGATTAVAAPPAPAPATAPAVAAPPAPPGGPSGPRSSRLGGAILIAGAAALAIVLAIVLIDGGSSTGGSHASATTGATTPTNAQTQTSTTGTTTGASRAPAARPLAAAVLRSPSGGSAIGAGIVTSSSGRRLLAVEAAKLAPNGTNDIYAIWLQGTAGSRFMGFVPNRVGSDGTFTVSALLDRSLDLASYATLLVTREGTTAVPATPGTVVLSGPLRSTG